MATKLMWKQVDEYLCYSSNIRRGRFFHRPRFKCTVQTPMDWELSMGGLTARLSWYGNSDGCWAMNFPLIDKAEYSTDGGVSAGWRITGISSLEEAKKYAEEFVLKEILILKTMVDDALDCFQPN